MTPGTSAPLLLRLDPADNVAVATRDLAAGEAATIGELRLVLSEAVPIGHKVAVRPIAAGERILKYRTPIGSATRDIPPGTLVHTHNVRSDYIPTYTLEAGRRFGEAS